MHPSSIILLVLFTVTTIGSAQDCNSFVAKLNHQYFGGLETKIGDSSVAACKNACLKQSYTDGCDGIDYDKVRKACYLFKTIQSLPRRSNVDVDSYVRVCKAGFKTCPKPKTHIYSNWTTSDGFNVYSVVTYVCRNDSFKLVGDKQQMCLTNGTWSGTFPTCVRQCPSFDLAIGNFRSIDLNDDYNENSEARFYCARGYKLVGNGGSNLRVCQSNFMWNGSPLRCQLLECPLLPVNTTLNVTYQEGRTPDSVAKFYCSTGYKMIGESERICFWNETWSGQMPSCQQIQCPMPKPAENSHLISTDRNNVGSKLTYTCLNDGFTMTAGDKERVCQRNGTWSGVEPTCEPITCRALVPPANSKVSYTSQNYAHSKAIFMCLKGFGLRGPAMRECLPSGQWSETSPECLRVCVDTIRVPQFGTVDKLSNGGLLAGDTVTYSCLYGYKLVGSAKQVCDNDGSWIGSPPTCEPPTTTTPSTTTTSTTSPTTTTAPTTITTTTTTTTSTTTASPSTSTATTSSTTTSTPTTTITSTTTTTTAPTTRYIQPLSITTTTIPTTQSRTQPTTTFTTPASQTATPSIPTAQTIASTQTGQPISTGGNPNAGVGALLHEDDKSSSNLPLIIGATIGGLLLAAIILTAIIVFTKRNQPPPPPGSQKFDNPEDADNDIKIDIGQQSVMFDKAKDDWRANPTYRETDDIVDDEDVDFEYQDDNLYANPKSFLQPDA